MAKVSLSQSRHFPESQERPHKHLSGVLTRLTGSSHSSAWQSHFPIEQMEKPRLTETVPCLGHSSDERRGCSPYSHV